MQTILAHPDFMAKARFMNLFALFRGDVLLTYTGKKFFQEKKKYLKFFKLSTIDSYIPKYQEGLEKLNQYILDNIKADEATFPDANQLVTRFCFQNVEGMHS